MLKTLQCPTCAGPVSEEVQEKPIQCVYCDAWVTTIAGHQKSLKLTRKQAQEMARGAQPAEPIIREDSPLGRLMGRLRRIAPVVLGIPLAWVLVMHVFVGAGWVGIYAVPMGGADGLNLFTFLIWVACALFGYGIWAALVMLFMAGSQGALLVQELSVSASIGTYLESESGIIAMVMVGGPLVTSIAWGMAQSKESFVHIGKKLQAAWFRILFAFLLGGVFGVLFFSRPTYYRYLESRRAQIEDQVAEFKVLCDSLDLTETLPNPSLEPKPNLAFNGYGKTPGNVETVPCSRASSGEWEYEYRNGWQPHPELMMSTELSSLLSQFYKTHHRDKFLIDPEREKIDAALSAPYWLLYDPRPCQKGGSGTIFAHLYSSVTKTLVVAVKDTCESSDMGTRKKLLHSLSEATDGKFTSRR